MKTDLCFHSRKISIREVDRSLPGIIEILERYGISFSYLLGSILFEETRAQDLDIAIYIESPKRSILDYYNEVYFDLCDLFKADNIDVVILNSVGFPFRYEVIKKGRLIYSPDCQVLEKFIENTLFHFDDIKSFMEEYGAELHRRGKEGLLMARRKLSKERIDTFIDSINRSLDEIKLNLSGIRDLTTFKETKQVRELCIHYLRIALEGVLNICRHIIAVKGFGLPDMERENLIDLLGMKNVIPLDFARKIRGMQGMRNAIIHVYWNLDYEKIYMTISENLRDFEDFVRYIIEYVENE